MNSAEELTIKKNVLDPEAPEALRNLEQEMLQQELAREAIRWETVLAKPEGREFFMDILRFLGFGQATFDLNDKKLTALSATKDAADALFSRAMRHCRHEAVTMLEENF